MGPLFCYRGGKSMSTLHAYLAGVVDSDGCIGLHSCGVGRPKRLSISVATADYDTVLLLKRTFGGSINKHTPTTVWRWKVTARKAREIGVFLKPYLRIKVIP